LQDSLKFAQTEVMDKNLVPISKTLARYLRHAPDEIGLTLEPGGWVGVDALLNALKQKGKIVTREKLEAVVTQNEKQRFSFDATRERIRANQGHSTPVDLELEPMEPPQTLYHGTAHANLAAILETGLTRMRRHHVHLSHDTETAHRVGSRHGKPVVLTVRAQAMRDAGFVFYRSENGVWLADSVPAEYLSLE
jgi:putative RNA 2'-phosphotransferase